MIPAPWRPVAVVLVATSLVLGGGVTGYTHDSLAPPGAPHTWLPQEKWVDRHWVTFEEQALKGALGLHGRDIEAYLYNDHHVLADLARLRGIDPAQLADRLVEPWRETADAARLALLHDHTMRILTQGHLAQHVFFHVFHGIGIRSAARWIFGVSGDRYSQLRRQGHTPLRIGRLGGVPPEAVRNGMIELFRIRRDAGIRRGYSWPAEAQRIFERQVRALPCWLRKPIAPDDAANPYGKGRSYHGGHARHWPSTHAQRRRAERRAERFRRSLPRSCWRVPPAWKWHTHGLTPPWG